MSCAATDSCRRSVGYPANGGDALANLENRFGSRIDPRVERTRQAIWLALLSLSRARGYGAVTVADIARAAGINRSTFYAHFPDKEAVIREELGRLKRDLRARQEEPTPVTVDRFDPERPHPNATRWFEHVAEHEAFYGAVLVTGELATFEHEIGAQMQAYASARLRAWPGKLAPEIPLDALIAASSALNIGLVRWWLQQTPRPAPEDVAVIQQKLMARGIIPLMGLQVGPS